MIRYRETGEQQPITYLGASVRLTVRAGNPDRAVELLSREAGDFRMGAYGAAARPHVVEYLADFLGHDPRYQAVLAEAGSTW
jgi:hypothetical protein